MGDTAILCFTCVAALALPRVDRNVRGSSQKQNHRYYAVLSVRNPWHASIAEFELRITKLLSD